MEIERRIQLIELMNHFSLPLIAVELGVAGGSFSEELLQSGMEKVYSVDAWEHQPDISGDGNYPQTFHEENYKNAKERLSKYGDRSVVIKGFSHEVAEQFEDKSIGLVYIDCNHSYEAVKSDIESYYPKIVSGGLLAFHDFENDGYGVKKAAEEFCIANNIEIHTIPENHPNNCSAWFQI